MPRPAPEDFFNAMTGAISVIQRDVGGEVHRGKNPSGKDVFIHISPEGEITEVPFSGDAVKDLNILRLLVTPVDIAAET